MSSPLCPKMVTPTGRPQPGQYHEEGRVRVHWVAIPGLVTHSFTQKTFYNCDYVVMRWRYVSVDMSPMMGPLSVPRKKKKWIKNEHGVLVEWYLTWWGTEVLCYKHVVVWFGPPHIVYGLAWDRNCSSAVRVHVTVMSEQERIAGEVFMWAARVWVPGCGAERVAATVWHTGRGLPVALVTDYRGWNFSPSPLPRIAFFDTGRETKIKKE